MRSIVFAPVFLAILTLAGCDGGISTTDDDDDTQNNTEVFAMGICAPGRGQEALPLLTQEEIEIEQSGQPCQTLEDCPSGALCKAFQVCTDWPEGGGGCSRWAWEPTNPSTCQFHMCRPDVEGDCDPGVRCYVRDPEVTTGRCAGGPHQGDSCDPDSEGDFESYECGNAAIPVTCSDSVYICSEIFSKGSCVWEDYFEAFCPSGACDDNPFCPDNLSCDSPLMCGCPDGFACVGFDDAASCVEITNPLIGIMPGMWQDVRPGWPSLFRVFVDPSRPSCESEDYPVTGQEPGDACVFSWGPFDYHFSTLVLDGTALRLDFAPDEHPSIVEILGEVLNDGWRIEFTIFSYESDPRHEAFIRIGDFEDIAD